MMLCSNLRRVNSKAGIKPVKVPQEFIDFTSSSIKYSKLTNGIFDVSVGYCLIFGKQERRKTVFLLMSRYQIYHRVSDIELSETVKRLN